MYVAVRSDLDPGLQMAQGGHAMAQFWATFPSIAEVWFRHSNWLIYVAVPDEQGLLDLANAAGGKGLRSIVVREPDLDNAATAVALEPGDAARRLCAQFPRALRAPRNEQPVEELQVKPPWYRRLRKKK